MVMERKFFPPGRETSD
jgi:hypothetical protein